MSETKESSPFRDWWRRHSPDISDGADRAVFARLRRCATPVEALMEAPSILLARRLGIQADEDAKLERIGTIAAVLAHVRQDDVGTHFAARLGQGESDDAKRLSRLRFGALMAAEPGPRQLEAFRRAVAIADHKGDVEGIGRSILYWGERTRARWTFEYWGAGAAAQALLTAETDA